MILSHQKKNPDIEQAAYIADSADIVGEVSLGRNTSVWFNAAVRADLAPVSIGNESNVQDNAVIHVNRDAPTRIGERVTVGHSAVVHGCTIEDDSLIGIGAVILDGAVIGRESLVAAGALVSPGKTYPPRSLIMGVPAKVVRTMTDKDVEEIRMNAVHYIEKAVEFRKERDSDTENRSTENS